MLPKVGVHDREWSPSSGIRLRPMELRDALHEWLDSPEPVESARTGTDSSPADWNEEAPSGRIPFLIF
jgi:hypothetical protein